MKIKVRLRTVTYMGHIARWLDHSADDSDRGNSVIAEHHSAHQVAERYQALYGEYLAAMHKSRGDTYMLYVVTYDWRIEEHQAQCGMIEQLQQEGLIDSAKLFPRCGSHATVRTDVEAFDRFIYARWERGLSIKDARSGEEKKREYRVFLGDRERNYRKEYMDWLANTDVGDVKVEM